MGAPCAGVPLPGGRPVPSGRMLMSQAAMSAGSIGLPRFGTWARAALVTTANARVAANVEDLRVNIFHFSLRIDSPSRDAVVVLSRECGNGRGSFALAARGDELRARWLHVAGFVPGAALQSRRTAVPLPRQSEARKRFAQHRLLQRRLRPALAAVGRHHDFGNSTVARIGDARNLIEPRPLQRQSRRWMG